MTFGYPDTGRAHHLDVARAVLMLLGIPYHAAMPYRLGQPWINGPVPGAPGFATLAEAIHMMRMPAFFVVAGWFAALLLARNSAATWWRGRLVRLGVPLLASLVTLVPLLNLACEWPQRPWPAALASFAHEYATSPGYWVRHLWFLIVLLQLSSLCVLACLARPHLRTATLPDRLDAALARRPGLWLAAAALVIAACEAGTIEAFYALGLAGAVWQQALRLDDLLAALPFFTLGLLLARAPRAMAAFERPGIAMAAVALGAAALHLALLNRVHPALGRALAAIAAVTVTRVLLAACRRWFDRPSRTVDALVAASFPIYLVHLGVVVALVSLCDAAGVGAWAAFPLVCLGTLALSWAFARLTLRVPLLALLYAGRPFSRSAAPPAPRT
ncbi:acyltransferase family protein [Sphingomonas jatrophae]|uniref:acyltransferase family protein n=1 Tax=Sphingomonas jatrophae TaxID=1166337 RepID=UPI001042831C|nr:acyltransferase family protein [Sphingomonas jatrophae]